MIPVHEQEPSSTDGAAKEAMGKKEALKCAGRQMDKDRIVDGLVKAYFDDIVQGPVSPKHADLVNSFGIS